jgi:hypothetical protein
MNGQEKITYSENGLIRAIEPFDFNKSLNFLEDFGSTEENRLFTKVPSPKRSLSTGKP